MPPEQPRRKEVPRPDPCRDLRTYHRTGRERCRIRAGKGLFPLPARNTGTVQGRRCGRFSGVDDMPNRIHGDSADDGEKDADRVGKSIERGGGSCAKKVDREAGLCNKR